jgi:hypothetical protein
MDPLETLLLPSCYLPSLFLQACTILAPDLATPETWRGPLGLSSLACSMLALCALPYKRDFAPVTEFSIFLSQP